MTQFYRFKIGAAALLMSIALLFAVGETRADFITNGNFATNGGAGQLTVNTTLTGWTGGGKEGSFGSQTTPPVFVFTPGTTTQLSTTGVNGDAFMGNVKFYGATAAPGSGVVIAAMGDPAWAGSLKQTISGLTVGDVYALQFNWAGAQQSGFSGLTTEKWSVTLGSSNQSTSTVNTPSQTFAGWQTATLDFTATLASEQLLFTATGSPSGETPWLLLNNVQMNDVTPAGSPSAPAPPTLAAFAIGAVAVVRRRRAVPAPLGT